MQKVLVGLAFMVVICKDSFNSILENIDFKLVVGAECWEKIHYLILLLLRSKVEAIVVFLSVKKGSIPDVSMEDFFILPNTEFSNSFEKGSGSEQPCLKLQ